jgi:hypothetical protein
MKDLRLQLISAGHKVSDDDLVTTTLASIKLNDYEPVINVLTIARKDELSFDEVQAELILHETKLARKESKGKKTQDEAAFNAKETRKCYNCDKIGHLSAECRSKRRPRRRQTNQQNGPAAKKADETPEEYAWVASTLPAKGGTPTKL